MLRFARAGVKRRSLFGSFQSLAGSPRARGEAGGALAGRAPPAGSRAWIGCVARRVVV